VSKTIGKLAIEQGLDYVFDEGDLKGKIFVIVLTPATRRLLVEEGDD
jgi:hypothetical protein